MLTPANAARAIDFYCKMVDRVILMVVNLTWSLGHKEIIVTDYCSNTAAI